MSAAFSINRLQRQIRPYRLHWYPRLGSTNTQAGKLRRLHRLFSPAIVLTGRQVCGRGRATNAWWSGPGCLTATFALPVRDHLLPHQVPLLAGLAVRDAVAAFCGTPDIQLKWPNDLLYQNAKLAGLLCERLDRIDLIGVGLNVNVTSRQLPRHLRDRVTSLLLMTGRRFDLTDLLSSIAMTLLRTMSQRDEPPFQQLLREYEQHHSLTGRRLSVASASNGHDGPVSGICEGLDSQGRLLVRTRSGLSRIVAGHVMTI